MPESNRRNQILVDTTNSRFAKLRPIPLVEVEFRGGFWERWQKITLGSALAHGYEQLERTHTLDNFKILAAELTGEFRGKWFADSDLYKWLEAASYALRFKTDPGLCAKVEESVRLIRAAQHEDGYLNTFYQLTSFAKRWTNMAAGHELYCAGHMFQAAVAHFRMTGKTDFLEVAVKFADHIDSVFGPGKLQDPPGHPEIEMALVELYRVTGEKRYLELASFLVDQRGKGFLGGEDHHQDHLPIREVTSVAGHAVRQLYLLAGVTDLYLETGEEVLLRQLENLWKDMTGSKISVTGGVGSTPKIRVAGGVDNPYFRGEGFGQAYELPIFNVHNETCAQIADVMWNWRMLLATGEARYADIIEWTLYNSVLSGISLDGTKYFYTNVMASRGDVERNEWFGVACCPPNVMRTLASISNYVATASDRGLQIHLYDQGRVSAKTGNNNSITLNIQTQYPWKELVRLKIEAAEQPSMTLSLRIPSWCSEASVNLNSSKIDRPVTPGTYFEIDRVWKPGDTVELYLPMQARMLEANPLVETTRNCVSIARGPVVYCFEEIDQEEGVRVLDAEIDTRIDLEIRWDKKTLEGIVVITGQGYALDHSDWQDILYRPFVKQDRPKKTATKLQAIPYYAWANRSKSPMCVWIPKSCAD
ncbi:MAG: glycoside hydrolase family 127 protein [Spirochaetaceae bacterium]|nr:MAG: glycoside hydrolase family 127 protein [Spirochaetaceae bacterium]